MVFVHCKWYHWSLSCSSGSFVIYWHLQGHLMPLRTKCFDFDLLGCPCETSSYELGRNHAIMFPLLMILCFVSGVLQMEYQQLWCLTPCG